MQIPVDFQPPEAAAPAAASPPPAVAELRVTAGARFVTLAATISAEGAGSVDPCSAEGTAAALSAALQRIDGALPGLGLGWGSSLFVHLYVPSMAQFGAANAAYSRFLPAINPPSRATVELARSPELGLAVEVLFARCGKSAFGGGHLTALPFLHTRVCCRRLRT